MLGGGAVQWKSQIQKMVSLSSIEAEYKALPTYAAEVTYLKRIMADMGIVEKKMTIYEDNAGTMKLAENWESTRRTKRFATSQILHTYTSTTVARVYDGG